jgi:toxin ParE1/3/4
MSLVTISRPARQDLLDHFAYIAADRPDSADRFLRVAEASFARLAHSPEIGRAWLSDSPRLAGVRVRPLPSGFRRYLEFYRPTRDGIEVLRVLHSARDILVVLGGIRKPDA